MRLLEDKDLHVSGRLNQGKWGSAEHRTFWKVAEPNRTEPNRTLKTELLQKKIPCSQIKCKLDGWIVLLYVSYRFTLVHCQFSVLKYRKLTWGIFSLPSSERRKQEVTWLFCRKKVRSSATFAEPKEPNLWPNRPAEPNRIFRFGLPLSNWKHKP